MGIYCTDLGSILGIPYDPQVPPGMISECKGKRRSWVLPLKPKYSK